MKKCLKKLSLNKKLFYFPLSPLHISIYLSLSLICFSLSSVTVFLSLSSWLTTIDLTRHRYCRSPHVAANLKRCRPLHSHCHPILSLLRSPCSSLMEGYIHSWLIGLIFGFSFSLSHWV